MIAVPEFRRLVWRHYRKYGRHVLPWRKTHNVYRILVSEIMLQQTQVDRVLPFYEQFLKQFPTAKKLADATLADVLKAWQGLGYNRRAKMLHVAARILAHRPIKTISELETLPGVGPYTARAVAAFAWNEDVVVIETNIRTVIIHHFFKERTGVSDAELEEVLKDVLPHGRAREWYSALMDYGAHLKRTGVSHNARTKSYTKQSTFKGSNREARGAILRALAQRSATNTELEMLLGTKRIEQMRAARSALLKERLIMQKRGRYVLGS